MGARLVRQVTEGDGELKFGRGWGRRVGLEVATEHFLIVERGFDGTQAANTPMGCNHCVDEAALGGGGGLIRSDVFVKDFFELVRAFAS